MNTIYHAAAYKQVPMVEMNTLQSFKNNVNKLHNILWESENKKGYIHGFTSNYIKVRQFWNPLLVNSIQKKYLSGIDNDGYARID